MRSRLSLRLARLLAGRLTPFLEGRGFRKKGSTYLSRLREVAWVVDIQKSRWNDDDEAQFTINGGVYVPGVVSVYSPRREPARPTIVDCCLSVRIGMLDETRLDRWWKLASCDPPDLDARIGEELRTRVEMFLIPFLLRFESPSDVASFLEGEVAPSDRLVFPRSMAQRWAYASILFAGLGDESRARLSLERAMREAEGSPIEGVIRRLGDHVLSGR